jgi:HD-GYP domain-containing protein (c-di-GMP phosphodiesterase class II)
VEVYRKPDESKEAAKRGEEDGAGMGREEKAQLTYFHALDLVTAAGRSGTVGGIRKARRLAQNIVDLAMGGTTLLLGLATTKDLEDHVHVHSVNVAFIATCLGRRLGLSRVLLEHLALSALYHDLGRSERVKEEFFKQGGKAVESWDRTKRHSLVGIREIVRLNAPAPVRSRILPGVFEHHLNCDLTGHPKTHFVKSLTLYGKILRIADVYEVLTSERGSSPQALTPDEALRHMWSDRGKRFDPLLMKLFVAMMGIYPIGSIVELSTGERGIVMDYLSESDLTQPYVLLLEDDGRGGLAPGKKIDLASPDAFVDGRARVVKRTLHFSELGIQPSEYFQKGLDLG